MRTKFFYFVALAAFALVACNNDEPTPTVDRLADTEISINAAVAELTPQNAPRRAPNATHAGAETSNLADLGLFITNEANSKYTYTNIQYLKGADNNFAVQGDVTPLWQNETQKIDVVAYSPYNSAWSDLSAAQAIEVHTDQTQDANILASDLLWASATVTPNAYQPGDIRYNNGGLDITLNHILSKVTVNVRFGTEIPDERSIPAGGLIVKGLNSKAALVLANVGISNQSTVADITAYKNEAAANGYDVAFEAIVIPQTSAFSVSIGLDDGRSFAWSSENSFAFQSGMAYTLNLIVGKDKVELAEDGITVGDWTEGRGDDLVTW